MSRHLDQSAVEAAVHRSGQVEQLLGIDAAAKGRGIVRWLSLSCVDDDFVLRLHVVEDVGSENFADVSSFPAADPDEEEGEGVIVASSACFEFAEVRSIELGAATDRWVNQGLVDDEYLDARDGPGAG